MPIRIFGSAQLTLRLHIHGLVMSAWIALFLIQACLVSAHRVDLHRRLGAMGVLVAVLVVVMGSTTTFNAAAREMGLHSDQATTSVIVLGLELMQMALFAGLVWAAIALRRRPDSHRRLMLLATTCLLPSAFSRIPMNLTFMVSGFLSIVLMFDIFIVVCVSVDSLRNRRLHPAFGWGGAVTLAALNLTYVGTATPSWIKFGTWLVS